MESWFEEVSLIAPVILAGFLGALIGFEREYAKQPAGLRTHTLVAASACLILNLGDVLIVQAEGLPGVSADPNRALSAVVSGIGFLGAGTILRMEDEGKVTGLATAASVFFAAGIGLAVGANRYVSAILVTVFVLGVLHLAGRLEVKLFGHKDEADDGT